jgi:site-specific DNA recombinase
METTARQLTAALYGRVSRLDPDRDSKADQERSVTQQLAANEKACAQYGWTITARYADPGRSASRFATRARENWEMVVAAVAAREFDVLVLWETSRASRDPEEWIPLLAECRRAGIQIYVTADDELYDLTKPKHWKTLASDGIANAFTSEETSQRVRRGVDAHAEDGKPYGPVLYGYERIYDPKTKELVEQREHPEHAPVVVDIIESVYRGKALMSIAARLNDDGIPSPRGAKWTMRTVRRVALNQGYIGLRGHNGHTTQGTWPPLVDETVFYGAKRILTDPKRTTTRPGRAKWLASCIARCGVCNGWMAVLRRGANRTVYQCRDHGCVWIEREQVDDYLIKLVIERLARPDAYRHLPDGADESAVEALRGELAGLRAELDGYADDAAEGRIDRAFAAKVVGKLNTKIAEVQRRIEAAVTPPALVGLLAGDPGEDVTTRWDRAPISARREVLRLLFDSIAVAKGPGEVQDRVVHQWR